MDEFARSYPLLYGAMAALIGFFVNHFIANSLQTRRLLKEHKAQLLKELMATRFSSSLDQKAAEAINFIPVLFANEEKVRERYAIYHSAIINGFSSRDISNKFNSLIIEMAKNIGINLDHIDLMRDPIFSHDLSMKNKQFEIDNYEMEKKYKEHLVMLNSKKNINENQEHKNAQCKICNL